MTRPDWCPADVWEVALLTSASINSGTILHDIITNNCARAILAERERCANVGRSAVMKFRSRVGGRYYAGYHEDMREAVATAIRAGTPCP